MHTRPDPIVHTPGRRVAASLLTLLAGFTVSACSAFFVPDVKDDKVERCNTSEDCTEPNDNRHIAQCIYGEGQPENSPKVCAAAFRELTCHPQVQGGEGRLEDLYDDVTSPQVRLLYGSCSMENQGKRGCSPRAAAPECDDGLEVIGEVCDDPDALYPAINPSTVGGSDIAGQDVLDQLCRNYYCDESFVCDQSGTKPICRQCDPNEAFGAGGCGTIYIQGEPSPVYTHIDEDGGNCNGEVDLVDIEFGEAPSAP